MLAKLSDTLPRGDFLYEPKWDGFRAIVFRGASEIFIQSRDSRPFDRYFPDLHEALFERGCCRVERSAQLNRRAPRQKSRTFGPGRQQ